MHCIYFLYILLFIRTSSYHNLPSCVAMDKRFFRIACTVQVIWPVLFLYKVSINVIWDDRLKWKLISLWVLRECLLLKNKSFKSNLKSLLSLMLILSRIKSFTRCRSYYNTSIRQSVLREIKRLSIHRNKKKICLHLMQNIAQDCFHATFILAFA